MTHIFKHIKNKGQNGKVVKISCLNNFTLLRSKNYLKFSREVFLYWSFFKYLIQKHTKYRVSHQPLCWRQNKSWTVIKRYVGINKMRFFFLRVLGWKRPFDSNIFVLLMRSSSSRKCLNNLPIIPQPAKDIFKFCNSQFAYPANIDLHRRFWGIQKPRKPILIRNNGGEMQCWKFFWALIRNHIWAFSQDIGVFKGLGFKKADFWFGNFN